MMLVEKNSIDYVELLSS